MRELLWWRGTKVIYDATVRRRGFEPMPENVRLRLRLLGRFAASTDGVLPQMLQVSAPRHRGLLAYLAMQPTYAETRERLATLLWSDRPDKQARQSLRQLLLTLRQELEPAAIDVLRVERDRVGLDPALVSVDVRDLLALAQLDPAQEIERAAETEYGIFLDGVSLDSEGFEEWLRGERARVEAAAAQMFLRSAERHDAAGHGAPAVRAAERLVALDPLRESAHRLLLRLLARYRGRDAALVHVARLTALLRDELDAGPEPETAALIGEIEALQEKRASLPAPATPVTVRPAEPPSEPAAAEAAAPPAPQFSRTTIGLAGAGLAIALVVVGVLLLEPSPAVQTSEAPTVAEPPQAADAWRTPVLAGVSPEVQALAAQGVYPLLLLPFTAAADRGEEKVLADRVTDDLTNELSRVPALRVIARATARGYAGRPVDVAAIGNELGVRYVVEGSVQLQDGHLRINAALIDVTTRLQVWADRFEREAAERFAVQDEVARSIARHLNVNVYAAEGQRRGPPRAGDPAIEELLAKGWNGIIRSFELGTTSGADSYFEEVLRRQPGNGSATLGLAGYKLAVVAQFLVPQREPHLSEADGVGDQGAQRQSALAHGQLLSRPAAQAARRAEGRTRAVRQGAGDESELRAGLCECRTCDVARRPRRRGARACALCDPPQSEGSESRSLEPVCRPDRARARAGRRRARMDQACGRAASAQPVQPREPRGGARARGRRARGRQARRDPRRDRPLAHPRRDGGAADQHLRPRDGAAPADRGVAQGARRNHRLSPLPRQRIFPAVSVKIGLPRIFAPDLTTCMTLA